MEENKVKIDNKVVKKVEKLAKELFSLIGVETKLELSHDKENDVVKIEITSTEAMGLLIGRRGETINAIQSVLGMMARTALSGWVRIVVNIGDYREKQEDSLKDLATNTAARARETGEPQTLYNLTPSQRRIVHMSLSEESDLVTESQGEGLERHLIVSLKK